jgi:hypothetical protein
MRIRYIKHRSICWMYKLKLKKININSSRKVGKMLKLILDMYLINLIKIIQKNHCKKCKLSRLKIPGI